jgi:hypothetical protein
MIRFLGCAVLLLSGLFIYAPDILWMAKYGVLDGTVLGLNLHASILLGESEWLGLFMWLYPAILGLLMMMYTPYRSPGRRSR